MDDDDFGQISVEFFVEFFLVELQDSVDLAVVGLIVSICAIVEKDDGVSLVCDLSDQGSGQIDQSGRVSRVEPRRALWPCEAGAFPCRRWRLGTAL